MTNTQIPLSKFQMIKSKVIPLAGIFWLASLSNAHAYIDPSMGAFILQGVLGAFAGIMLFFSQLRERLLSFFGIESKNSEKTKVAADSANQDKK